MRWRFTDRVDTFVPWRSIAGRKTVSLEEYSLPDPFGRAGACPASLVMECCVELGRWLAAASSGFEQAAVLEGVEAFAFRGAAGPGDALAVTVSVTRRGAEALDVDCRVEAGGRPVAGGALRLVLVPLGEGFARDRVAAQWRELYAAPG
jgi:3-hydroxymyristoyl/3-hydroxydecanoyl-(acyl carrier protein) dehydratase